MKEGATSRGDLSANGAESDHGKLFLEAVTMVYLVRKPETCGPVGDEDDNWFDRFDMKSDKCCKAKVPGWLVPAKPGALYATCCSREGQ